MSQIVPPVLGFIAATLFMVLLRLNVVVDELRAIHENTAFTGEPCHPSP